MGDEVKITVIATGFRDQMPERRARMLSVEQTPVVSVPLVSIPPGSVPLAASRAWLEEPLAAPLPLPRFLSQDEEREDEAPFFAPAKPAAEQSATPAIEEHEKVEPEEHVAALVGTQIAELTTEPHLSPPLIDYASNSLDTLGGRRQLDEVRAQPVAQHFAESDEEPQRDLDVPAFMRRLQF
jgi:cell division protein FtsZ